jgi:hypothetical protein
MGWSGARSLWLGCSRPNTETCALRGPLSNDRVRSRRSPRLYELNMGNCRPAGRSARPDSNPSRHSGVNAHFAGSNSLTNA